ncbi:MAG: UDP-N-acetylmuramoyl-L-alanine--D-glutamate ligase [Treponema sp.]|nr:UDP-N-acetylmuramoyl-L-alanine--D-glutamate ligase [Treponema sp.]
MDFSGMKVLVMGLGLHGGGLECARFLRDRGAELTITDLRDEKTLAPSIESLESGGAGFAPARYVLGRHEMADFQGADLVIKNPGVRPDSPFLKAAPRIETDISLFLNEAPARIVAVTGSKGKSSASSAIFWALDRAYKAGGERRAFLGGNIAVSPLSFLGELRETDDVVLELSSWQLGDLRGRRKTREGRELPLLKPKAAVLTAIFPDHQDFYGGMEPYVADKRVIYEGQDQSDATIAWDDGWGKSFLAESRAAGLVCSSAPLAEGANGGWLESAEGPGLARLSGPVAAGLFGRRASSEPSVIEEIVPARLLIPGRHQKRNLLASGLALLALGLRPEEIRAGFETFAGIEHRMEMFRSSGGIHFYNDSAATIPEAAAQAVEALAALGGLVLVTGGTDKNLDFLPLARAAERAKAVALLAGTGSEKLRALLDAAGVAYLGPFDSIDAAAAAAIAAAASGDSVALSPGCASFGMFLNEFDRGRKWKAAISRLA